MQLGKYSFGVGDRFSMQGRFQLRALQLAAERGVDITPVWNKSNREHLTIGSAPLQTRQAADSAVSALGWERPYFVDADHINLSTVDRFIPHADFFTIDVAHYIGKEADQDAVEKFMASNKAHIGLLQIPGVEPQYEVTEEVLYVVARKYLFAAQQAGAIYRHIAGVKGTGRFITEVSMDEVDQAQSPLELFFILSALSDEGVPVDTIAPKFTGRFNKGVDYVGDLDVFAREFRQDLLVIDFAVKEFGLPEHLKLSVHSGSDKFSLYPIMGRLIREYDKGIHVKTAGTTWLEEVIGLSMSGGNALALIKEIYIGALNRFDELAGPYATVIDIDCNALPSASEVQGWGGQKMADTLRHIADHPDYNIHVRQLMHVAYKLAAEAGEKYLSLLKEHQDLVGRQVTENLFDRHIRRLFDLKYCD